MKFPFITLVLLLCVTINSYTQNLKVLDANNLQPIPNVFVFSDEKSTVTDENGEADILIFETSDSIRFQHRSYKSAHFSLSEVKVFGGVIYLEEDLLRVNEVLVSVNRWEQNKREIPNKIEAVRSKEVNFYNPQTAADLVGLSDQVYIQKSQLGGGSPMIRGFSANRVLLVVDGVRLNNAIYRSGNLQNVITMDPQIMDNSEVIFGPGSVIYGSDAIGGVMDFHTRQVKLSTSDDAYLRLNALSRFSSANMEKTGHLDFSYGKKRWGMLSSVSFSDFDDQIMGVGGFPDYELPMYVRVYNDHDSIFLNTKPNKQVGSGYSQMNLMQKFRFRPSKSLDIIYAFHYSRSSEVPRYDRLFQMSDDKPKYAEWYYGPHKWLMHTLGAELTDTTPLFDQVRVTLAYQAYSESRHDRRLGDDWIRERYEYLDIGSINVDLDKKINAKNELFYGVEWTSNRVFSLGMSRNVYTDELMSESSRYPDGGTLYLNSGVYSGLKNYISDRLTLVTGLRANYVSLNSKFISKQFFSFPYNEIAISNMAFNGSIGVAWVPSDDWQFNTNLSSGFRAPNLDDVGKVFDSEPGNVIVPNGDLRPEYAINADIGVIKLLGDKAKLDVTAFYTYLFDAMVRRDYSFNGQDSIFYDGELSKVEAIVNADWAHVYGVSASINWNVISNLFLKSSITATYGEDSGSVPLRHVAPVFGASHLIYQKNKFKGDFFIRYNGTKIHDQMSPSELAKEYMYTLDENGELFSPGWYTLNINVAYQLQSLIQINAGIENLLNTRYRPYSSGIASPGRNFMLTVRASI
ncbi:MAG: TonB-dependent receptor [Bacteroidetes bacterium]|jgi:hemoglobin/transferrin/lactoferrin receptor protein|nr:TonB-dependent receptor [Bacteroidota bacterium]MBT3750261.1 TonB-dependent receptor [Bacteroidota bacterium]MBT4400460.1 TonB-dependent receptor [Bacteroidota bacterium]MBT4410338.1 TonB-dependent receptor [Bacteroidota bacterium]MBT5425630.1 TonB-dependent receptor [Bacteroidota bacterium]